MNSAQDTQDAEADTACYDAETLDDLGRMFGPARLTEFLDGLADEIDRRLTPPAPERAELARDAHAMISVSGGLGFDRLSCACADLEQTCLTGGDIDAARDRVAAIAEQTRAAITALVQRMR